MPIYDYKCSECGPKLDIWAKMNQEDIACPDCGRFMERLISAPNIICDISPYLDGHMDSKPVPVFSRQDKMAKLKERGLYIK